MTAPLTQSAGQAPVPQRGEDVTEALPVLPRTPVASAAAEVPTVEVAVGQILDDDTDLALDAQFGRFDSKAAPPAPPAAPAPPPPIEITREIVAEVVPSPAPEPADDLDALELVDIAESAAPEPITNLSTGPELSLDPPAAGEVFALNEEPSAPIELRPSSASEFQSPDASNELLDLTPGRSEFQVPDASAELTLSSSGGSEYQTPSGSEELLRVAERQAEAEAEPEPLALAEPEPPVAAEEPPRPYSQVITTGFAAISLMPTEEMPTDLPDEPLALLEPEPESESELMEPAEIDIAPGGEADTGPFMAAAMEAEPEPEVEETESLVDMLAAAAAPAPEPEAVAMAAEETAAPQEHDLKLIFPEDGEAPEPPRRRITEAVAAPVEYDAADPGVAEPAPVMTESMAELYLRQGHLAEAINVYRSLLERTPHDERLQEKVRGLEATLNAGSRRMSYVAMDTGGESVESFFRTLADARPAGAAAHRPMVEDQGGGAPTRPTNDPLSLSAIFGEEASAAAQSTAVSEATAKPAAPDAFSFDQFFGGSLSGSGAAASGSARPEGEDLDQFQHWLKSLKK
jgi:hypothetical protein